MHDQADFSISLRAFRAIGAGILVLAACSDPVAPFDGAPATSQVGVFAVSAVVDTATGHVVLVARNSGAAAADFRAGDCSAQLVIAAERNDLPVFDSRTSSCADILHSLAVDGGATREWSRGVAEAHHLSGIVTAGRRAFVLVTLPGRDPAWLSATIR